jgi:N-acetylglucosamine-6-phosphate deacetylase
VTLCLPTIITARPDELAARLRALDRAIAASPLGQAMCPGYHLEGPFLNPSEGYRGCHPHEAMTAASTTLIEHLEERVSRPILLVTVAPEIDGAIDLVRWASERGKVIAMGHTSATGETLARAVEAGLALSTHLGNGLPQQLHKFYNTIFAQLAEDRLNADFIADGIHIMPQALKVMLRAKGVERSILVTDAVSAAAAPPGLYPLAGFTVERDENGRVHLPGQAVLAGSSLTLDAAVRNVVNWGFASFEEAIAMASDNPRRLLARAFAAHKIEAPRGRVTWSAPIEVTQVSVTP